MGALMTDRLIEAREKKGYNRKQFAEMLGIPYRTITNYENGSREPGCVYLSNVADICGVTVDWLLGLTDKTEPPRSVRIDPVFDVLKGNYENLNEEGRMKLVEYSDDLVQSKKYKKCDPSGLLDAQ